MPVSTKQHPQYHSGASKQRRQDEEGGGRGEGGLSVVTDKKAEASFAGRCRLESHQGTCHELVKSYIQTRRLSCKLLELRLGTAWQGSLQLNCGAMHIARLGGSTV